MRRLIYYVASAFSYCFLRTLSPCIFPPWVCDNTSSHSLYLPLRDRILLLTICCCRQSLYNPQVAYSLYLYSFIFLSFDFPRFNETISASHSERKLVPLGEIPFVFFFTHPSFILCTVSLYQGEKAVMDPHQSDNKEHLNFSRISILLSFPLVWSCAESLRLVALCCWITFFRVRVIKVLVSGWIALQLVFASVCLLMMAALFLAILICWKHGMEYNNRVV